MELKKWAKILLASYSVFETMAGVLDKYIETRALNSMKSTLLTAESNSATRVCHDLGIMMVRKIDIDVCRKYVNSQQSPQRACSH